MGILPDVGGSSGRGNVCKYNMFIIQNAQRSLGTTIFKSYA